MTFSVDVVLKGRDFAVTESVTVPHGDPQTWSDAAVRDVLVEILRAIARVQDPEAAAGRQVLLLSLRSKFPWAPPSPARSASTSRCSTA